MAIITMVFHQLNQGEITTNATVNILVIVHPQLIYYIPQKILSLVSYLILNNLYRIINSCSKLIFE